MPSADGKFTKTNEQILTENDSVSAWLEQLSNAAGNDPTARIMADGLSMIYTRLGDMLMWAKERR